MFSDIIDASEFCEIKRVNGVAKLGPKKNDPTNGKAGPHSNQICG